MVFITEYPTTAYNYTISFTQKELEELQTLMEHVLDSKVSDLGVDLLDKLNKVINR